MTAWLVSGLFAASAFLALVALVDRLGHRRAVSALAAETVPARATTPMVGIGDRHRAGAELVARLGHTRLASRLPHQARLERYLVLAGRAGESARVRGIQMTAAGGAVILAGLVAVQRLPALAAAPLAAVVAVRAPELQVARQAARRQEQIARSVPDLVELLLATTEAGLSPPVALKRTADVLRGPLADEVRSAVGEVDLGVPWQQALAHMIERTDVSSLRSLAMALRRSRRLGTPVGSTLRAVADDLRGERRIRAEEMARKAPIKMLFPLVFLILPAFLLLTVGPVVLATIRSLH